MSDLIEMATEVLRPVEANGQSFGKVAAALISGAGNVYRGVSLEMGCGIGFCAEHSAVAAMVTAGEHQVSEIVAVNRDAAGDVRVIAPCGRCRELLWQLHPTNRDTQVIVGPGESVPLSDLLPRYWKTW